MESDTENIHALFLHQYIVPDVDRIWSLWFLQFPPKTELSNQLSLLAHTLLCGTKLVR